MIFTSLPFFVFLIVTFLVFWSAETYSLRLGNAVLLGASYFFYGWWDYRFLSLICITSSIDFTLGLLIDRETRPGWRKYYLNLSIVCNVGILAFFKYCNFFISSFSNLVCALGFQPNMPVLHIILPVGISFYTFKSLSYSIDVYRKKIRAIHDPVAYFAFVSFFPQLLAGPIEKARDFLPQFDERRIFDRERGKDGIRQIAWGLFKKIVIADNLCAYVDDIFANYASAQGPVLLIGAFLFACQIYCDFSGYSDISIGTAKLFGFRLKPNFALPYFARDIAEFWRRWHISLSTWFRDYVYIPLGGNRVGTPRRIVNILVTFCVSGLWHGANWTFFVWGLLHGMFYIPLMLAGRQKGHSGISAQGRLLPGMKESFSMASTFTLTMLAWVFFRSSTITQALVYIGRIFAYPDRISDIFAFLLPMGLCLTVFCVEWVQRDKSHALEVGTLPMFFRQCAYASVLFPIAATVAFKYLLQSAAPAPFIYFQF